VSTRQVRSSICDYCTERDAGSESLPAPGNAVCRPQNRKGYLSRFLLAAVILMTVSAAAALIYVFEPAQFQRVPLCLFNKLTGLQCPACGATRATHHLLHGNFASAFRLNPLVFVFYPILGYGLLSEILELVAGITLPAIRFSRAGAWTIAACVVAFTILRNIL
jgi:hypothetical protein